MFSFLMGVLLTELSCPWQTAFLLAFILRHNQTTKIMVTNVNNGIVVPMITAALEPEQSEEAPQAFPTQHPYLQALISHVVPAKSTDEA